MPPEQRDDQFKEIRRIAELSSDGSLLFDLEKKRIVYINEALVKITEVNKKVWMADPELVLESAGEQERDYLKIQFTELMQRKALEGVQIRFMQNHREKTLSLSGYVSSAGTHVIGFVKDISKPKEHEDYLVNFGARKDALLDSISRALATPLNLSRFTIDLIDKAIREKKYQKINAQVAVIKEVTSECIRVIDHFMRKEHLESPEVYTKANRFDVIDKIKIVLESMKSSNADKKFRFKSDVNHLFVTGDDVKFIQIIHNLLSNAVKFTGEDGEIDLIVENGIHDVTIVVQDNGIGIPERLQPYIFEKDTRAARQGLKGEASNGIGLYVIKKLTDLMNGSIAFESKENKGTRFMLKLPKA